MASLKDIKRRIHAVRGTQKVTRAMKLVAAAKLKRAQQTAVDAREYSSNLYKVAMRVSRRLGSRAPLMWRRPQKLNCLDLIVITSDRGLCGGFNENLLRLVEDGIQVTRGIGIDVKIFAIGKKGVRYFKKKGYDFESPAENMSDEEVVSWLTKRTMERFEKGESAGSNIAFNRFISASKQEVEFWNLLPLQKRGSLLERNLEYLYEPVREEALDNLCISTVMGSLRLVLLESRAAELAARMLAMDNATKNADDMISHLTFVYNRARQESITSELMDIVSGAEALK